jgi:hypothetical protein
MNRNYSRVVMLIYTLIIKSIEICPIVLDIKDKARHILPADVD